MTLCKIAPLVLVIGACSSAPVTRASVDPVKPTAVVEAPKPKALDPSGTFEYTTEVNGQGVSGQMIVTPVATGGYVGKVTSNIMPEFPITSVTVKDQEITMKGMTDSGELVIVLNMTGDNFAGRWALGNDGGEIKGKKLPKQ